MTKYEKLMVGAMAILIIAVVGLALSLSKSGKISLGASETRPTYISQDATGMNDLYEYGDLEVAGTSYLRGTIKTYGDTRLATLVQTGSIATFTATSTATAANVCDNPLWTITAATNTPVITLPATTTLFADCMTTNGDVKMVNLLNGSGATSTVIAAGTGGTLLYSSSTTIAAGKGALLRVVRDSATTYTAGLINLSN